jgi:4-amino-4-deoxy-L-arabinose transferase-like glycosyltransferase
MQSKLSKKLLIGGFLILLMMSAFQNRLNNFNNSRTRTTDETVYFVMAKQIMNQGFSGYHTIPYGEYLEKHNRVVHEYFRKPVFKHPPIFTFLILGFLKIFGMSYQSAGLISICMHVLTIPLVFLLGNFLCDKRVGIFAALLYWMDPVSIICSQKIWPGSTICFFSTLAIVFFAHAIKKQSNSSFILSGVASGLATLTKYTGFHATILIILYALVHDRKLFKSRFFLASLLLPFMLLIPWVYWNFTVYGASFLGEQYSSHGHIAKLVAVMPSLKMIFLFAIVVISSVLLIKGVFKNKLCELSKEKESKSVESSKIIGWCFVVVLMVGIWPNIVNGFTVNFLPSVSWGPNHLPSEPLFYFGRLVEFTPIYLISFVMFLMPEKSKEMGLLRIGVVVIIGFFIIWQNYQSRYIIAAIPLLLVMASNLIVRCYDNLERLDNFLPRILFKLGFVTMLGVIYLRVKHVNVFLSFTNDMCYF